MPPDTKPLRDAGTSKEFRGIYSVFLKLRWLRSVGLYLLFLLSSFCSATCCADEDVRFYRPEAQVIERLHNAVDRGLGEELQQNGLAYLAAGVTSAMIGFDWGALNQVMTGEIADLLYTDFRLRALLRGAAFGGLAAFLNTYLKGPSQFISKPASAVWYLFNQLYDAVLYEETSPELARRSFQFMFPVALRMKAVVERQFSIPGEDWTISTMNMTTPDHFSTSNYRIIIYDSMMPIAKNQAGMACIIGHEMGHVLAKHNGQRLVDTLLFKKYALASLPFANPISQKRELQADEIGIYLTALAGYDPTECARVWERMLAFSGDYRGIFNLFLSEHPTSADRMEALEVLAESLKEYYYGRQRVLGLGRDYQF